MMRTVPWLVAAMILTHSAQAASLAPALATAAFAAVPDSAGVAISTVATAKTAAVAVSAVTDPPPPSRPAPPARHSGKSSLNVQNADVRALIQMLADLNGLNVVLADSVGGQISVTLNNVPNDRLLDIILQARGLDLRRQGDVAWIAPKDELMQREKQQLEQRAQMGDLEPLHSEVFQLQYQKAETFRKVFSQYDDSGATPGRTGGISGASGNGNGGTVAVPDPARPAGETLAAPGAAPVTIATPGPRAGLLSRRGSAVVDTRTNQLFVTDTAAVLERIRKLIARVDIAARQVMIEARIVEADDSFSKNLGVRLGFATVPIGTGTAAESAAPSGAAGNAGGKSSGAGKAASAAPTSSDYNVDLPAAALAGMRAAAFGVTLVNAAANRFVSLELSALEADGKGRIVSSPRVVTADQQSALIEQGEEIPYQQATSSGATSIAFKRANLKLEVTPQITPDGNVILSVDVNKDSRGAMTPGGLAINTRHIKTQVQVENGGTLVIGGIYTQTDVDRVHKVPLLGDIPVLGALFRNSATVRDKTELLIFLTPSILAERDAGAAEAAYRAAPDSLLP